MNYTVRPFQIPTPARDEWSQHWTRLSHGCEIVLLPMHGDDDRWNWVINQDGKCVCEGVAGGLDATKRMAERIAIAISEAEIPF